MRPVDRRAAGAVALALLVAGTSCTAPPLAPTAPPSADLAAPFQGDPRMALAAAERRWAERGPRNYDFTVAIYCFCFGPNAVRFEVRDGVSAAPGADAATAERFRDLSRVELHFDRIRRILDNNPYYFNVAYDPALGHPTSYFVDYALWMADDEFGASISGFAVR